LDINFYHLKHGKENKNIKYILTNAVIPTSLHMIDKKPFDLVLDDGSHHPNEQIDVARLFVPWGSKDGMFICEDINEMNQDMVRKEFRK
jgi:hypothetical protein